MHCLPWAAGCTGAPLTKKRWVSEGQEGLMNTAEGPLSERCLRMVRSLGWDDPLEEGTPVFMPRESHRQRRLVGYSP